MNYYNNFYLNVSGVKDNLTDDDDGPNLSEMDKWKSENLEELIQQEKEKLFNHIEDYWGSFWKNNLTDIERMNVEIKIDQFLGVLSSTFNRIKLSFCGIIAVQNKDCDPNLKMIYDELSAKEERSRHKMKRNELNFSCDLFLDALEKNRDKILQFKPSISLLKQKFLNDLHEMLILSKRQLNILAPKELAREHYLFALWEDNKKFKERIVILFDKIKKFNDSSESKITERQQVIAESHREIAAIKRRGAEEASITIQRYERKMTKLCQMSTIDQQEIQQKIDESQTDYDTFLARNQQHHKKSAEDKYKKEVNLLNWIQKYDSEVRERHFSLEDENEKLNEQKEINAELQRKKLIQDEEYKIYKDAQREELRAQVRQRMLNNQAKIIQKWWKKMYKKMLKRRKKEIKAMRRKNKKKN